MWPLLKSEIRKTIRRRETQVFLAAFILLPILLAYSFGHPGKGVTVRGQYDAATLATVQLGFLGALLLPYLTVILVAATSVAREVDDGSMKMLHVRSGNRVGIFASKFLGVTLYCIAVASTIILATVVGYYLFVRNTPTDAGGLLEHSTRDLGYQATLLVFGLVTIGAVTMVLGLKTGFAGSVAGGMGLLITMKILERWEAVKGYLPTVLADLSTHNRSGFILLPIYAMVLLLSGMWAFRRMDLK